MCCVCIYLGTCDDGDFICFCRAQFPSESVHILSDHSEEVWFVKFSHNGSMLVSGSKDGQIIIWNTSVSFFGDVHTFYFMHLTVLMVTMVPMTIIVMLCVSFVLLNCLNYSEACATRTNETCHSVVLQLSYNMSCTNITCSCMSSLTIVNL